MRKAIVNFIYLASITFSFVSIHEAFADRGPSVEPFTEVDIENTKAPSKPSGFNFNETAKTEVHSNRKPAGIVARDPQSTTSPYSIIGPLIFLFALPFAIWMIISKKLSDNNGSDDKVEYYSKSLQFKPYKTEYQKTTDDDHDDVDFPKAS